MGPVDYSIASGAPSASTGISGLAKAGTMPGLELAGGPATSQLGLTAPTGAMSSAAPAGSSSMFGKAGEFFEGLGNGSNRSPRTVFPIDLFFVPNPQSRLRQMAL
jgi:hypothetical protein